MHRYGSPYLSSYVDLDNQSHKLEPVCALNLYQNSVFHQRMIVMLGFEFLNWDIFVCTLSSELGK